MPLSWYRTTHLGQCYREDANCFGRYPSVKTGHATGIIVFGDWPTGSKHPVFVFIIVLFDFVPRKRAACRENTREIYIRLSAHFSEEFRAVQPHRPFSANADGTWYCRGRRRRKGGLRKFHSLRFSRLPGGHFYGVSYWFLILARLLNGKHSNLKSCEKIHFPHRHPALNFLSLNLTRNSTCANHSPE